MKSLVLLALLFASPSLAWAQGGDLSSLGIAPGQLEGVCAPEWSAPFGHLPGVGNGGTGPGSINAAAVFDDGLGGGPMLYIGGTFNTVDGRPAKNFARWNGSGWESVGGGVNGVIWAMTVADVGSGPRLFLGGSFTLGGGAVTLANVCTWNGVTFADVGGGVNAPVYSLLNVPGGAGPNDLVVIGGSFITAGGITSGGFGINAKRVVTWNGAGFLALSSGFDDGIVFDLELFNGLIHACGTFFASGGTTMHEIARWSGSTWQAIGGGGATVGGGNMRAMTVYDDGNGPMLVVGGTFSFVGAPTVAASRIAAWNGSTWSALGAGLDGTYVLSLAVWDDGSGPDLYAAGAFDDAVAGGASKGIARWDGVTWSAVGAGIDTLPTLHPVNELVAFDDGSGEALWSLGSFIQAGGLSAGGVARWDGLAWSATSEGASHEIEVVCRGDFEGAPALYVGGPEFFSAPGAVHTQGLARYMNDSWSGFGSVEGSVEALVVFNDGSGPALYVGGSFTSVSNLPIANLARWNGFGWASVGGGGVAGTVKSLEVWNDGSGPALYVGGDIGTIGGLTVNALARWDGASWSGVGDGLGAGGAQVNDLVGHDGSLYATGAFSPSIGAPGNGIARWDGAAWHALGDGLEQGATSGVGQCLAVYDDGGGKRVFVGGEFDHAGGDPALEHLAAWDGTWGGPSANNEVLSLAVYDAGAGAALFAGGWFTQLGGVSCNRIGSWDGVAAQPMGPGISQLGSEVRTLVVHDDGSGNGPQLIIGGDFTIVPGVLPEGGSFLAAWGGCWDGVDAWTDLGFALPGTFGDPLLIGLGSLALGSENTLALLNAKPLEMAGLFLSLSSTPVPFVGGTLVPFPYIGPTVLTVSSTSTIVLDYTIAECLPPGTTLYAQWAIVDSGAIYGIALSNAVVGTTP